MTDPKEMNTVDKLFRDTFNNLPDTPAPDGWDTPSELVWGRIRREIGAAVAADGINTRWMLAVLSVGIVIAGMYLLRNTENNTLPEVPKSNEVNVSQAASVAESTDLKVNQQVVAGEKELVPSSKSRKVPPVVHDGLRVVKEEIIESRMKGAAPLPGTSKPVAPNTTEERKAALEKIWNTPLEMLPIRRR